MTPGWVGPQAVLPHRMVPLAVLHIQVGLQTGLPNWMGTQMGPRGTSSSWVC